MAIDFFNFLIQEGLYESKTYDQNEVIKYFHNINPKKIYLIKSGVVKISYPVESGEKLISIILKEDQFFGANQLCNEFNYNYTYESICKQTEVYEFEIEQIQLMIKKNNIPPKEVCYLLGQEYFMLEKRIQILQNRFVEKRFVDTMVEFREKFEVRKNKDDSICIGIPLNQSELANYIRASRVILNKVINKLKRKSLIEPRKNKMILKKKYLKLFNR